MTVCRDCGCTADLGITDPTTARVIALCLPCAYGLSNKLHLPGLAEAIRQHEERHHPASGQYELRIRPGVHRDDAGRWRAFCRIDGPRPGEVRMYEGEWIEGPNAEAEAGARAKQLARGIRATVARSPRIRVAD